MDLMEEIISNTLLTLFLVFYNIDSIRSHLVGSLNPSSLVKHVGIQEATSILGVLDQWYGIEKH